ncbi:uncharacterized protein LY79DRAFT_524300 [Colletotrichum navitas]|uniref:Uncharacterized protein n=1 Tax=Colletotrichum navitas TaxID=681940 RepID=A0AAD8V1B5_9PEZI|nr:uncharacterized protein LY79DRAFT_524300 [Colletotrichum navitas]KAK1574200.1 hypothetical protein LY79DRAFT_524300 [Colletotrichum navitas]
MVSTKLICLVAGAAVLAGINGQVVTTTIALTTITVTAFTTVGFSDSFSSTADSYTTTIPSTTPLGVIPITASTTTTILLPSLNTTSSSAAVQPAFISPNNNVIVTSVSTVPTHTLVVRLFQPLANQHHDGRLNLYPRQHADVLGHWWSHAGHKVVRKHNESRQQPSHLFLKPSPERLSADPLQASLEHYWPSLCHHSSRIHVPDCRGGCWRARSKTV